MAVVLDDLAKYEAKRLQGDNNSEGSPVGDVSFVVVEEGVDPILRIFCFCHWTICK